MRCEIKYYVHVHYFVSMRRTQSESNMTNSKLIYKSMKS